MRNFTANPDKPFLKKRVGSLSQIAGLRRYEFTDGKAKGVEAVEVRTGGGLSFTVLPGRGMDIAWAEYRGTAFSYISKTGIVSPYYYESAGAEWLRTFFAGLLTTCGLSNAGGPSEDAHPVLGKQHYGLHGRISNTMAENVCVKEEWTGNGYEMSISGRMREGLLHGENLSLTRTIRTSMGKKSFVIHDIVENEGTDDAGLMMLYHINLGYPLVDQNTRIRCKGSAVTPISDDARKHAAEWDSYESPVHGANEHLFFHNLTADNNGDVLIAAVNLDLEFGVYLKYAKSCLPEFTQWKMIGEAEYVLGLEPGNCNPVGRAALKQQNKLEYVKPGQKREFTIEIGILDGVEEIERFG